MTERIMLDIETLGRSRGCAVASVGAVKFDSGGLGEEFHRTVSLESSQAAGLNIDAGTVEWWFKQGDDARQELIGGDELGDVLRDFAQFYGDADELWAKSPAFDCVILEAAYDAIGVPAPWSYWETRDVRTVMSLPGAEKLPHDGTEHRALDDAKRQGRNVAAALKEVDG
jgi:hypothetical protein